MAHAQERAEELFRAGFSCAQAICAAFAGEEIGRGAALRIASAFGGGMARRGDTCGALSGALMVLGLLYGSDRVEDDRSKETMYRLAEEMIDRFTARSGSRMCRELIGFDPAAAAGRRRFSEDPELVERCAGFVREAAGLLEELIAEHPRPAR